MCIYLSNLSICTHSEQDGSSGDESGDDDDASFADVDDLEGIRLLLTSLLSF